MDGRHSPSKTRSTRTDSSRLAGKHSKSTDDGAVSTKPHTQGRRVLQQPLHIRVSQNKTSTEGSVTGRSVSTIPELPRRTRSTPSYANVLPLRHAHPQPSTTVGPVRHAHSQPQSTATPPKTNDSTSPIQAHRQSYQDIPAKRHPVLPTQHSQPAPSTQHKLDPTKQKLVDRAIRARLYYLRKSGPSRFLIGGDSPDSRFHVTIGPQSCSCNKSHCVHILFVMLRVFKLSQNDPILWRKTILNYEAEAMLREFQARVSLRNTPRKSSIKKFEFVSRNDESIESVDNDGAKTTPTHSVGNSPAMTMDRSDSLILLDTPPDAINTSPGLLVENPAIQECSVESEAGVDVVCDVGDKSDGEEEVCPICLNELDEGEDLLTCSGCNNQLHQHCMDVWAGEQKRKQEDVQCPVCRAPCSYNSPVSASPTTAHTTMPVSVPVSTPKGVAVGVVESSKGSSPSHAVLSEDKKILFEKLKAMFGVGSAEGLFSPNWKLREASLSHLSRESITYLLPHVTAKFQSREPGEEEESARRVQGVCMAVVAHSCNDSVLKVFLAALELLRVILSYSVCYNASEANKLQSLLKPVLPFLITRCADAQRRVKECSIDTACNLCLGQEGPLCVGSSCGQQASCGVSNVRLILKCALDYGPEKTHSWNWWLGRMTLMDKLLARFSWEFLLPQCMLKPLSPQPSAASDSDTDDMSSGTISGLASPYDSITSNLSLALPDTSPESVEVVHKTSSGRGTESGSVEIKLEDISNLSPEIELTEENAFESMSPVVKNNLLMQCWYFAAKATHVSHSKVAKAARRVIVRVAKVLRDDPSSLEIIYDVIAKCHRTSAEGLLDRVLHAREKPQESLVPMKDIQVSREEHKFSHPRLLHSPSQPVASYVNRLLGSDLEPVARTLSKELSEEEEEDKVETHSLADVDVESSLRLLVPRPQAPLRTSTELGERKSPIEPTGPGTDQTLEASKTLTAIEIDDDDFVNSDDSFRSAVSELDQTLSDEGVRSRNKSSEGTEEGSSSASNSHDSRSGDRQLHSDSSASIASGGVGVSSTTSGNGVKKSSIVTRQPYYKRQSTIDSAFGSEFESSIDSGSIFPCKRNIEEEEAEALAKVRSMIPEDPPHPSLSNLIPPSDEVLVYVQPSVGKDEDDGPSENDYRLRPYIEGIHWIKGKVIGTGAFCTCHRARDTENGTMFAVKHVSYVRNTKDQEEEELRRLREEIAMLGRLSHPNIVRCLGATQEDGHINIFVEWMAGGCLDQILHDFGPLKESVICNYTRQITLGIVYLHENHIIHRDLKGGNILLDSTGRRIRIADFGASARLAANTTGPGEFQDMEGTVAFMAPEVVRGGSSDDSSQPMGYGRKCDVWSIGCVIIQMATAKPPWVGSYDVRNKYQLIFKIGQATTPPPLPNFSNPALKDLTIRCLEVKPSDRPTSSDLLNHPLFTEKLS